MLLQFFKVKHLSVNLPFKNKIAEYLLSVNTLNIIFPHFSPPPAENTLQRIPCREYLAENTCNKYLTENLLAVNSCSKYPLNAYL